MRRVAWVALLLAGCRPAAPPPASDARTPAVSQPSPGPEQKPRVLVVPSPLFGRCVQHAGGASASRTQVRMDGGVVSTSASGECDFNAECIAQHGDAGAGDGFVALACQGADCTCSVTPLAPGVDPQTMRFTLEASCADVATAERLLVERCIAWVPDGALAWPRRAELR